MEETLTQHDSTFDTTQLLNALTSVRNGDFSTRLPNAWPGINGKIADRFNEIVELNQALASELERIRKTVGEQGKISQRVALEGSKGTWITMVESMNGLISDLIWPTSEMARVIGAVAKGDLSQTMALEVEGRPLRGEFLRAAKTVNTMVEQLGGFASEVIRVAREVGTDGKLGGQAKVKGVAGVWKDLTDNVNLMASNLTDQVRNIAEVTTAVAQGDLSKKITVDVRGEILQLKNTINVMVDQLNAFASEVTRVAREVGTEGKLGGQAAVPGVAGVWKELTDNVNFMASNLTDQVRNIAEVTTAIAQGDLSKKITVDVKGEILQMKNTINTLVDQLNGFASEVTRVAREVGTEGKLGGQAEVKGVSGVWKDLTDNVNFMASNLTGQVRNIAEVTTAIAEGDLSKKITVDVKGEILQMKNTINVMVDQLNAFASEVTRVAREVGTEGKLGGQAAVPDVAGVWKELTDNVNFMASNLTGQVRNIAEVTTAIAQGDLSKKITVDVKGEILQMKNTINTMVDQLNGFAAEVTRVAREVGTEGKLGGQATVPGVAGVWKDLTDNVNFMASNLTDQVRNIAEVTTAVAQGDLSKKITVDVKGEILQLKNTINVMVDQLNAFASEVTRVAREVGTEGKLGGQAEVEGVAGVWKDLTDNVNLMASNLTGQVRNIAEVTIAVANGDLSKKITVDARGEILQLKEAVNTMVDQLRAFASEVTRVAREVGTEGKLGGQAEVKDVAGVWKDLTDNVNSMASNLTDQVRNIAEVTTAVAQGDLSKKITVDVRGEILQLKNTINTMVDQLNGFANEVTRVAREVGTEGKLGGQAEVEGVAGVWKDLTDSVNSMASNLTGQVRNIAEVTIAVANGDLSKKITVDARGEILQLKEAINTMVDQLRAFASEVTRVAREVGTEGRLGGQAAVLGVAGVWKDLTDNVNFMASNLTDQVRNISEVTIAVANGDLSKKITVDARGEILQLKEAVNTMVDQLRTWSSEVTRVAREVGTEGKLGGQAAVPGIAGVWKDLTDSVNLMATNLTDQVRGIAKVVTAVANGDLKQKLSLVAKGEIAELADTINNMIDTLATFGAQVTNVAREVGVEGRLGGQAKVPGAAGTWKDLTDNVNQLAANLTTQVRAIAEVATAVAKGDLSRTIQVETSGELEELKNNINEMIRNLRETSGLNAEQDWLKTNLAQFTRMLQGQRDLLTVSQMILSELVTVVNAQHGVFYMMEENGHGKQLRLMSSYAYKERKNLSNVFRLGEGLVGQCALEKSRIVITNVPNDYIKISSGLGEATPQNIIVLPVLFEGEVKAVMELASFNEFSPTHQTFLEQLTESIGIMINTIEANMRTESLLAQSQSLARELQSQQEELRQTNEELEDKARLLEQQKSEVEAKKLEVEQAKRALEEKAEQLALTSKYKSEFLANMSHELRTPLNSLLILSQQLAENREGNLSNKQIEFANTIFSSGNDLLSLINDILDLSKIESRTVTIESEDVRFTDLQETMERIFRPVAESKRLGFDIYLDPDLPHVIQTDAKRLEQVLKNLLANAFKFTERGSVTLRMEIARRGWSAVHSKLNRAEKVISFTVIDTGIGIPFEKQKIIFEAFQQADSGTTRRFGGTGLGLAISREITNLLGGELRVIDSAPGRGSTFALFLPESQIVTPSEPIHREDGGSRSDGSSSVQPSPSLGTTAYQQPWNPAAVPTLQRPGPAQQQVEDDRLVIKPGDKVVLIVEDDVTFAKILLEMAHEQGLKGVVAVNGESALRMVHEYRPDAITLDIALPDINGWTVLDRLKANPATRTIPVHVISILPAEQEAAEHGAMTYLLKSANKQDLEDVFHQIEHYVERPHKLLVVEDNEGDRTAIRALLDDLDVSITGVGTGAEALEQLRCEAFDCMILDLRLPDISGQDLVTMVQEDAALRDVPIIIYTGKELTSEEEVWLGAKTKSVIKKGQSPQKLLADTAVFLQRVATSTPDEAQRLMSEQTAQLDMVLAGKKVLIVDDDIRNIFALTSLLERYKMRVLSAENGQAALDILQSTPDVGIVLMDIMMPEMDGYETIQAIRQMGQFAALPIVAVTAKAMKGDREKCLEAGASDYIAKPVESEQLLFILNRWLQPNRVN